MAEFSDAELAVIRQAVLEPSLDRACDLLAERFRGGALLAACDLADRVNRGEAEVAFSTGETFGRQLVRTTEVTPQPPAGGPT